MKNELYYIPANYTDAGRLFGLFEIRNAIEAVLLGLPLTAACAYWLPLFLMVPVVGFALIGLKDDSLTRFLRIWWTWRRRRRVMTYRGEVNSHEFERTYLRRRRQGRK